MTYNVSSETLNLTYLLVLKNYNMSLLCAVYGQAPTVRITMTDPHTFSRRFMRATRNQDVVMDCYVENLPPLTTVR